MRRQIHVLHDGGSIPPLQTGQPPVDRRPSAGGDTQATSWAQLGLQNPTCGVRSLGCLRMPNELMGMSV